MKFLVSVGSYERIVFGFDVELNKDLTVFSIHSVWIAYGFR